MCVCCVGMHVCRYVGVKVCDGFGVYVGLNLELGWRVDVVVVLFLNVHLLLDVGLVVVIYVCLYACMCVYVCCVCLWLCMCLCLLLCLWLCLC